MHALMMMIGDKGAPSGAGASLLASTSHNGQSNLPRLVHLVAPILIIFSPHMHQSCQASARAGGLQQ